MTLAALAEKVGVAGAYLCMIEAGRRAPSIRVLDGLLRNLDATPEEKKAVCRAWAHRRLRGGSRAWAAPDLTVFLDDAVVLVELKASRASAGGGGARSKSRYRASVLETLKRELGPRAVISYRETEAPARRAVSFLLEEPAAVSVVELIVRMPRADRGRKLAAIEQLLKG